MRRGRFMRRPAPLRRAAATPAPTPSPRTSSDAAPETSRSSTSDALDQTERPCCAFFGVGHTIYKGRYLPSLDEYVAHGYKADTYERFLADEKERADRAEAIGAAP